MAIRVPVQIDVTGDDLGQTLGQDADRAASSAGKSWESRLGGAIVKTSAVAAGAVTAIGAAIGGLALRGGIDRALNIEDAQAKLLGLGNSTETVATIMDNALAAVSGTAFGLGDAATVAANAVAAGIKPGQDLERTLSLVGDAATIAGADLTEIGSIFGQVAASGVLMGDDIAQLQDRGIPILQLVADQLGVTAQEAKNLASEGKVSFDTFQDAIEAGMGGAALESGNTFRGALANVSAALSRLGESVAVPILTQMTGLFGEVIEAADGLGPVAERVGTALGSAFSTSVAYIQGTVIPAVLGFFQAWRDGAGELGTIQAILGNVASVIQQLALDTVLPLVQNFFAAWASGTGDVGGTRDALATVLDVIASLTGFLSEHIGLVNAAIAAYLTWRGLQLAQSLYMTAAGLVASAAAWRADTTATIANGIAKARNLAQTAALAGLYVGQWVAAQAASIAGWVRETAVIVATRTAMVATAVAQRALAVAQGIATAAQWAFNAALTANPIGIIIVAVAALVAGLVWFFTQTEIGQKIVTVAWAGIQKAVTAVVNWFQGTALPFIRVFIAGTIQSFKNVRDQVSTAIGNLFDFLRKAFSYTPLGVIVNNFGAIVSFFRNFGSNTRSIVSGIWDTVLNLFRAGAQRAAFAVGAGLGQIVSRFVEIRNSIVSTVSGFGSLLYNAGRDLVSGFINGIQSLAGGAIDAARRMAESAVNTAKSLLGISSPSKVFQEIGMFTGEGFVSGINSSLSEIRDAAGSMANAALVGPPARQSAASVSALRNENAPVGGVQVVNNLYGPTTGSDVLRESTWTARFAPRTSRFEGPNVRGVMA